MKLKKQTIRSMPMEMAMPPTLKKGSVGCQTGACARATFRGCTSARINENGFPVTMPGKGNH